MIYKKKDNEQKLNNKKLGDINEIVKKKIMNKN
jgi:hypothetical protein